MSKFGRNDSGVSPVFGSNAKSANQDDVMKKMEEFKEFYEDRLTEIDVRGGGDNLELKLKVQRMWIDDLTEQTQMMAQIIDELEDEATTRVRMLEDKLKQTSKSAYEVMKRYQTYSIDHNLDEPFQKAFYLESDLKNLIEFVRRARDDGKWSIDGLHFYDITYKDLFGKERTCECDNEEILRREIEENKEVPPIDAKGTLTPEDLVEQLKRKSEEYEELRCTMLDMRAALTEEVACKHDMISALKKDIQQLEERCIQSDKQTAFKDDIIKELRKEIKQLKLQENTSFLDEALQKVLEQVRNMRKKVKTFYLKHKITQSRIKELESDNDSKNVLLAGLYNIVKGLLNKLTLSENKIREKEATLSQQLEEARNKLQVEMKSICTGTLPLEKKSVFIATEEPLVMQNPKLIQNKDDTIQIQNDTLNVIDLELQEVRKREKDLEEEMGRKQREIDDLKCQCVELEKQLANSQGRADNLQKAVDLYLNSINVLEAAEEKSRIEIEQQKLTISNLQEALVTVKHELDELRQNSQQEVLYYQYLCNVFYINLVDFEESYKRLQDSSFELEVEHFSSLQDIALLETQVYKYQSEFRSYEEAKFTAKEEIKNLRQQNKYYAHVIDCFKNEMTVMSEQLVHLQEMLKLSNQSCREENCQFSTALVELQIRSDQLQAQLVDTERKVLVENQKNQLKDAKIDELQLIIGQKNADLNIHDEAINDIKIKLENAILENHQLQTTISSLNSKLVQMEMEKARKSHKIASCKRSLSDCRDEKKMSYDVLYRELERVKEKNKEKVRNLKRQNEELKDKLATSELGNQNLMKQLAYLKEQSLSLNQKECCREHELAQSKQIILELRQTLIELNESLADSELHHMALAEEFHKSKSKVNKEQDDLYLSCKCEIALYKKLADNFKEALVETKKKVEEIEAKNRALNEELKNRENKISDIQKKAAKKDKENCQCIEDIKEKLRESQDKEKRVADFVQILKGELEKRDMQKVVVSCCECNDIKATQAEINSLKTEIRNMIQTQLALNNENDKLLKQVTTLQTNVATLEENNRNLKQKLEKLQHENQNLKDKNKTLVREKEAYVQTIRNLELDLADTKNCRDDICAESRQVINNVKAWLTEQKKIDERVKKKTQCYCDTIARLKEEKESLLMGRPIPTYERTFQRACTPLDCSWALGSQGTGPDSPQGSLASCTCSVEEWYSPTYRDDDTDEDFVHMIEATTLEMKNNNQKWKNKFNEFAVTRDNK